MRLIILILLGLLLTGCANDQDASCRVVDTQVVCPNGSSIDVTDGRIGLSEVLLLAGECKHIGNGVYVENIGNGKVFDVYSNDQCSDYLGEYCDNVVPSYPESGSVNNSHHYGSGTVCWAGNKQISGVKSSKTSTSILIKVITF